MNQSAAAGTVRVKSTHLADSLTLREGTGAYVLHVNDDGDRLSAICLSAWDPVHPATVDLISDLANNLADPGTPGVSEVWTLDCGYAVAVTTPRLPDGVRFARLFKDAAAVTSPVIDREATAWSREF